MPGFLNPRDLKEMTSEAESAKMDEERQYKLKQEKMKKELHEAFLSRELHPNVVKRINDAISIAARQGQHQIEVLTFPCQYCNDRGRRINNSDADWPDSLEGFAKKAYEFYARELKPLGFKLTAEVISFEGGVPGTIAMNLKW
ncbi:hypothetical protein [Hyphomicrobium sp. CS1BSMeth3]|uniref:hypothetical protein n=1 Tax=Hyphomicrobium sp. CS1BSMeth3 TaxID=1892844 RepID=UPI00093142DD|nr:hypothetical protein [Hyphomicrobium sp. CS1BSMeth3]